MPNLQIFAHVSSTHLHTRFPARHGSPLQVFHLGRKIRGASQSKELVAVHTEPPGLNTQRLRHVWRGIVRNPAGWQEKQCHQRAASDLRIVVRPGPRRGPAGALPALHPHQFCCVVNLHDAVDLPVWVFVVLALEFLLAVHVHCCDAEIASRRRGKRNLASFVVGARDFRLGDPAFREALLDVRAEVLVEWVSRAKFLV